MCGSSDCQMYVLKCLICCCKVGCDQDSPSVPRQRCRFSTDRLNYHSYMSFRSSNTNQRVRLIVQCLSCMCLCAFQAPSSVQVCVNTASVQAKFTPAVTKQTQSCVCCTHRFLATEIKMSGFHPLLSLLASPLLNLLLGY